MTLLRSTISRNVRTLNYLRLVESVTFPEKFWIAFLLKTLAKIETKKAADNNVMHAKPDLRVILKWMITGSGSVITDVIRLSLSLATTYAIPLTNVTYGSRCSFVLPRVSSVDPIYRLEIYALRIGGLR